MVEKPRPICVPTSSPASDTAPNMSCSTMPSAAPMATSRVRIASPSHEPIATAGIGPRVGAIASVIIAPSRILTVAGTPLSDRKGAVISRPRMRASGHRKAAIHACSWASPKLTIAIGAQFTSSGRLVSSVRV